MKYYDIERHIVIAPHPMKEVYYPYCEYLPPFCPSYDVSLEEVIKNPRNYIPLEEYKKSLG